MAARSPVIVAIDTPDYARAEHLVVSLAPHIAMVKLGLEFFCAHGAEGVKRITKGGEVPFFLDLKLHDIPNTMASAFRAVLPLKPQLVTVHGLAGKEGIARVMEHAKASATQVIAVTLLTSLSADAVADIGLGEIEPAIDRLAEIAISAGSDGLVCSPLEVQKLRARYGDDIVLVVPGIRPPGSEAKDQSRIATPLAALQAGASYLVIGRPITESANPVAVVQGLFG
jgi:orotidine-5'-phosphate decarboxylase